MLNLDIGDAVFYDHLLFEDDLVHDTVRFAAAYGTAVVSLTKALISPLLHMAGLSLSPALLFLISWSL